MAGKTAKAGPEATETGTARPLTLGTAGHIDHGKTTLVKALTGRDTDRLKEEQERGISIELGFAELVLPSGRHLSVVDVPGHERFVKTMVAGATGIDMFLLVVAADDGVMPQTREHLRIIELLDIPVGMVALTKIDMVDPELAELARTDVEEFLAGTRYADAPVVMVSGVTGEGIPELLDNLDRLGAAVPPRGAHPATRLPVDRVFTLKGVGTVVTGTLWSGSISQEDVVSILPGRGSRELREVRVRSLEVHDQEVPAAYGGQRVALNLTGIDRAAVARGQWVVKDPQIVPTYMADVRLTLLPDVPRPLERTSRLRVDHGTAEVLAKVFLADRESLLPGESCHAQLRFEEQVLVFPADPFIVRSLTPVTTIGGGRVIDPAPRKHGAGARWEQRLEVLERGSAEAIVTLLLEEAFPSFLTRRGLEASPYLWRFPAPVIREALAALSADRRAEPAGPSDAGAAHLFHGPSLAELEKTAKDRLTSKAAADPLDPYLSIGELRRVLARGKESPALDAALERLQQAGLVVRDEHGWRVPAASGPAEAPLDAAQARAMEAVLAAFLGPRPAATAVAPRPGPAGQAAPPADTPAESAADLAVAETPSVAQVAASAALPEAQVQKLTEALVRQGKLVKVGEDLYYPSERLKDLIDRLAKATEERGLLTLAEARDLLGTSRKYAQALLEHMDSEGLTLRVGEARRLRRKARA